MSDSTGIGDRMKQNYENRTRIFLPRRTNTIIRVDGKAFHTFTRGCEKPFDHKIINSMQITAKELCKQIQGAKYAFTQSDEISILLTDYDNIKTDAWFDGNIQKIVSISAAIASIVFSFNYGKPALFDSRVFTIPDYEEVKNYFIWRQQDWTRNSVSMAAQALYSQKQLHGKNMKDLHDMLMAKGVNWNDYATHLKRGTCIIKKEQDWVIDTECPIFTAKREYLDLPIIETEDKISVQVEQNENRTSNEQEKDIDG